MQNRFVAIGLVALGIASALGACSSEVIPPPRATVDLEGETCPAGIPGLAVRTVPVEAGVALVFSAPGDEEVSELRERLARYVEIHRREADRLGDPSARMQDSTMRVLDIPNGAQLEVRPRNEGWLRDVRRELEDDAAILRAGACPLAFEVVA